MRKRKTEHKFRIIKTKALDGDLYQVQLFRKFLWRERRIDVQNFDYEDSAKEFIECLKSYENPEVLGEYKMKF